MTRPVVVRRARLLVASIGLGLMLALSSAAPAQAHASVEGTNPQDGQIVTSVPEAITVTFNESVSLPPQGNQLLDAAGQPVEARIEAIDNVVKFTPASELARGTYIVSWRVISADTHPVAGGFTFSIGAPSSTAIDVPTGSADRHVSVLRAFSEVVRYLGVLGYAGLLLFIELIAGRALNRSTASRTLLDQWARWCAWAAVGGSLALIPLVRLWQDAEPLNQMTSLTWWRDALTGQPAVAAGVLIGGLMLARLGRSTQPAVTAAGIALVLGSLIVVGHTRSYGPPWLVLTADLVHISAAALWIGGILGLLVVLWPGQQIRPADAAAVIGRFSTAAAVIVAALIVAAGVLYWRIAGSWSALWTTSYGVLVAVKVALVAAVLAIAAFNRYQVVPSIAGNNERRHQMSVLRRAIVAEATILALVTAVTGVLVSQSPESATAAQNTGEDSTTLVADVNDLHVTFVITPARRGTNSVQITLADNNADPIDPIDPPTIAVALTEHDLGPFTHTVTRTGPGAYESSIDFPIEGTWTLTFGARLSEFESPVGA